MQFVPTLSLMSHAGPRMRCLFAWCLALLLATATADCDFQQQYNLKQCYGNFVKNLLNLDYLPPFAQIRSAENAYMTNVYNAAELRNKFNTLVNCLNRNVAIPCVVPETFAQATGVNSADAREYVSDFHQRDFMFNTGWPVLQGNFPCAMGVLQSTECNDGGATTCDALNQGIACLVGKAQNRCNDQVARLVYQLKLYSMSYEYPNCHVIEYPNQQGGGNPNNCDGQQQNILKQCYLSYINSLMGLSFFPSSTQLKNAEDNYMTSVPNAIELKTKFRNLQTCITENAAVGCLNVASYVAVTGLSEQDATAYLVTYYQRSYTFNNAWQVVQDNFQCVRDVSVNAACDIDTISCNSLNQETVCIVNKAQNRCNDQVGRYFYTFRTYFMQYTYPQCQIVNYPTGTETCNAQQQFSLSKCYIDYANILGFTYLPSVTDFVRAEENYMTSLPNAQELANKFATLKTCITQSGAAACLNVNSFAIATGRPHTDAIGYVVDYQQRDYMFGEGWQVLQSSFQCAHNVLQSTDCDNGDTSCNGLNQGITCLVRKSQNQCSDQVARLVYRLKVIFMQNTYPQCPILPYPTNGGGGGNPGTCDATQQFLYRKCYLDYLNSIGFTFFPSGASLMVAENNYMTSVPNGQELRDKYSSLQNCIKQNQLKGCVNANTFASVSGLSQADAVTFITDYYQRSYTFNDGWPVFQNNAQCVWQVSQSTDCSQTATTCDGQNQQITCLVKKAQNECGDQVGRYFYNLKVIFMQNTYPQCNIVAYPSGGGGDPGTCDATQQQNLKQCYYSYVTRLLGLNYFPSVTMLQMSERNEMTSVPNVQELKNTFSTLQNCIKGYSAAGCLTPTNFAQATALGTADATGYVVDYFQLDYMLNSAWQVTQNRIGLIYELLVPTPCPGSNAPACEGPNNLVACTVQAAIDRSDDELGRYFYQRESLFMQYTYPQCTITPYPTDRGSGSNDAPTRQSLWCFLTTAAVAVLISKLI